MLVGNVNDEREAVIRLTPKSANNHARDIDPDFGQAIPLRMNKPDSDIHNAFLHNQGIAVFKQHYPDDNAQDLVMIVHALDSLALPIKLADEFLARYRKHISPNPEALLDELYRKPPHDIFTDSADEEELVFRLYNLGRVFHDYAQLDQARQIFSLALNLERERYGENHPKTASGLNKLGTVLHDLGHLSAAMQAFERALSIDEAHYGPKHPNVARDINNLAILLQSTGDFEGAYESFRRAYAICEQALGAEHPYTIIVQNHLIQLEAAF